MQSRRLPVSLPTTASYVTALVRSAVWPWIAGGDAIYTNTDSVHLPAHVQGPPCGDAAGDWTIKESGEAKYHSTRNYHIGMKRILAPDVLRGRMHNTAAMPQEVSDE
jgi:hypothetical protein